MPEGTEDYHLLPHKEIEALKKELESIKGMEITPTKKLHISIVELSRNIEKLLDIFEEALHEIKVEEGGLLFSEKIKPIVNRMDRLENNMESIADVLSNIIAPTLSDIHDKLTLGEAEETSTIPPPGGLPPPPKLPPLPK